MWIPEPWHEVLADETDYDSHYEYLWNDTAFIHSIGCNVASCATGGDQYTSASKNLPRFADYDATMASMHQGFFIGDTATARGSLKSTAATMRLALIRATPVRATSTATMAAASAALS
jgi:hypothetical protein